MYLYLYDYFLNHKKYHSTLARIETRLTDLGIGGKIFRLSPLRNVEELIAEEVGNGVKTIVVVGNDKTLSQVINVSARFDATTGLIPLGPNNTIAQSLGIPEGAAACDILAARIVKKIDLGKINNIYFLSNLRLNDGPVTLECENSYTVTANEPRSTITICNLQPALAAEARGRYFDPEDGQLEMIIQPLTAGFFKLSKSNPLSQSIIPFKKLLIKSKTSTSVITDGQQVVKTPARVEVAPRKLKLIVGRGRQF